MYLRQNDLRVSLFEGTRLGVGTALGVKFAVQAYRFLEEDLRLALMYLELLTE